MSDGKKEEKSLVLELGRFVHRTSFQDLPPEVVAESSPGPPEK